MDQWRLDVLDQRLHESQGSMDRRLGEIVADLREIRQRIDLAGTAAKR